MIPLKEREEALKLIDQAVSDGACRPKACEAMEIDVRTYYREIWQKSVDDQKKHINRKPIILNAKPIQPLQVCI